MLIHASPLQGGQPDKRAHDPILHLHLRKAPSSIENRRRVWLTRSSSGQISRILLIAVRKTRRLLQLQNALCKVIFLTSSCLMFFATSVHTAERKAAPKVIPKLKSEISCLRSSGLPRPFLPNECQFQLIRFWSFSCPEMMVPNESEGVP